MNVATQLCIATALTMGALIIPTAIAGMIDGRRLEGARLWDKPLKFEISLAIYFATLAFVSNHLSAVAGASPTLRVTLIAAAGGAAFEMIYIILQAARGRQSHFNVSTPFYRAMYALMGLGAVIICLGSGVLACVVLLDHDVAMGFPLRLGAALGLGLSCIATLVTGFAMGGRLNRYIGHHDAQKGSLAFTGWSRTAGDLRVPHFVANHMAQVIIAVAWLARAAPIMAGSVIVCSVAAATCLASGVTWRRAFAGRAPI